MKICILDLIEASDPVQEALDSARPGDRVYLPGINVHSTSHPFYEAPQGGWRVEKNIEVYGDGPGHPGSHEGTTLCPGGETANDDIFVVEPNQSGIDNVYLHAFKVKERRGHAIPDGANGIRATASGDSIRALRLERISVLNLKETGFALDGLDPDETPIERLFITNCGSAACRDLGVRISNVRLAVAMRCGDNGSFQGGWLVERSAVLLLFVAFQFSGKGEPGILPDQGQLLLRACRAAALDSCWFEDFNDGLEKACQIKGVDNPPEADGSVWIGGCAFIIGAQDVGTGTAGIEISYPVVSGTVSVWPNGFTRVYGMVDVAATGVVGSVVFPQFNNTNQEDPPGPLEGVIFIAAPSNNGSIASPTIDREPGDDPAFAGFIIPSFSSYAEQNPSQYGMLYYDTANNRYRLRTAAGWRTVSLLP